jgi:2-dehydro-3-deoxygluconokinase
MAKITAFGEIMLRLSPAGHFRLFQSDIFQSSFGGSEANVAVSLAKLGIPVSFVTKLPENSIGVAAETALRIQGVNTKDILWGGNRIGLYFCEKGFAQRPSRVIYDRANSSIAESRRTEYHWDKIFDGNQWFLFSGITPALSDELAATVLEACKYAKAHGLTISCDLNYRNKLWTTKKAHLIMSELLQYVDYCFANEEDAYNVFGIKAEDSNINDGLLQKEGYVDVARQLTALFDLKGVAISLRRSISSTENGWSGLYYTEGQAYFSKEYMIHVIDRVGAGDAFCGGLLYALLSGKNNQDTVDFAVAASCLKHSIEGDFNLSTTDEVEQLLKSGGGGRIQR